MSAELSVKEHSNSKRENFKVETVAHLLTRLQKATLQAQDLAHEPTSSEANSNPQTKSLVSKNSRTKF